MTSPAPDPLPAQYLAIGRLRRAHGLSGEVLMDVLTDFPERIRPGGKVYAAEAHRPLQIASVRSHGGAMLIGFKEIHTPEEAAALRNQFLYVSAQDRPPLEPGEYYHHQLLGLRVVDETGQALGTLAEILSTGSNDVYIVRPESGHEILLPAIEDVILEVNLDAGEMRVHLLPGLI